MLALLVCIGSSRCGNGVYIVEVAGNPEEEGLLLIGRYGVPGHLSASGSVDRDSTDRVAREKSPLCRFVLVGESARCHTSARL